MLTAVRSSWVLFFGISLMMLGNGLQGTLLGVRASIESFDTVFTGVMMSGYFAGFFLGSTIVPRLIGGVGHVRTFSALSALASGAILAHAVWVDPFFWTIMRLVTGFCYAGMYIVAESWLNESTDNANRGRVLSAYMIVLQASMAAGQLLLNVADPGGMLLFMLISALVSMAVVPMLMSTHRMPAFEAIERLPVRRIYLASPLAVVGGFLSGMANGVVMGIGAVYAVQVGIGVAGASIFMAAINVGVIAFQWPIGRLSDRIDRRTVLIIFSFVAAGLSALGALVSGQAPWIIFLVAFVFGGTTIPLYAVFGAHLNDRVAQRHLVSAGATFVMVTELVRPSVRSWRRPP